MELTLQSLGDPGHFEIHNEDDVTIRTDTSPSEGGRHRGFRPMQLVLAGLASCSSIDVQNILKKQRQPVTDLQARVTAERATDEIPAVFTKIHVHYIVTGDVDPAKAERAASLSLEKYCSVSKMLQSTATITHSVEVIPNAE